VPATTIGLHVHALRRLRGSPHGSLRPRGDMIGVWLSGRRTPRRRSRIASPFRTRCSTIFGSACRVLAGPTRSPTRSGSTGRASPSCAVWRTTGETGRLACAGGEAQRLRPFPRFDRRDSPSLRPPAGGRPEPTPLLLIHGWPGSVWEFHELIPRLTDPDESFVTARSVPCRGSQRSTRTSR
jgi:hypothetical protein